MKVENDTISVEHAVDMINTQRNKTEKRIRVDHFILSTRYRRNYTDSDSSCIMELDCAKSDVKIQSAYNADTVFNTNETASKNTFTLTDKSVNFYEQGKSIFVNKDLTEPERAAVGFVVTFFDNGCDYDEGYWGNCEKLKCKPLSALGLGYQCSDQHLGFLRKWFRNDSLSLERLKRCPCFSLGSHSYGFDDIKLKVKDNLISVEYFVRERGYDGPNSYSTITDYFQLDKDNIRLIKEDIELKMIDINYDDDDV